jgi:hypothetical protein
MRRADVIDLILIAAATGSLIAAGIALLPLTWYTWPQEPISTQAWGAVLALVVLWGWLWPDEEVTLNVVLGGGVILLGTALATGLLGGKKSARKPSVDRA